MTQLTSNRPNQLVVSEGLWRLTGGDFYSAAVLAQLLTSSLSADGPSKQPDCTSPAELARGMNHLCSPQALTRRLDALAEAGWVEKHNDSQDSQYRVNLEAVERDLRQLGWDLEDALVALQ